MNEDRAADPTHPDAPLTAAVDRLRAARDTGAVPSGTAGATGDELGAPNHDPEPIGATLAASADLADELRRRLADRRDATASAKHAAAAYAALHGHVPGGADDELGQVGRPRWALRPRTALVAVVAMLVLVTAGAVVALLPRADVEDLAVVASDSGVQVPAGDEDAADSGAGTDTAAGARVEADAESTAGGAQASPETLVVVDVVGQVSQPGVVTVPAGSRVFDAVAAAGGATEQAELGSLNMARVVVDGEQIRVPAPGETVPPPATAPGPEAAGGGGPVDLNTGDEAQLDTLPGIGPALASRIVTWRTDNGPFASVDELDEVSGIGPALLADLRDLVTV